MNMFGSFPPSPLVGLRLQSLLGPGSRHCLWNHYTAGGDVADQIKQLQQKSRDAQMKNEASWAQQHLADGFVAGNSWGDRNFIVLQR